MSVKVGGLVLSLALVAGCASKATTPATSGVSPAAAPVSIAAVAGQYALVAVDGHVLPFAPRAASGAAARSIVSGSLLVNGDGTFRVQTTFASDAPGNSAAFSGACYPEGNEMKMVWDGGGSSMTLRGDTVLVKREGSLYAYLRSR